jgi:predicted transcriptional regulator of viral defense system
MPGAKYGAVFEVAFDNFGYFTVEQATAIDVSPKTLHAMVRRGTLQHVSTGLYRVAAIPLSPLAEYMEASLWPRGPQGVISHDSALVLHDLSDVNPAKIHVTVPRSHRIIRATPPLYVVHRADLRDSEVEYVDGIPVTSPVRTIVDCHRAHLGPALIRQALADGVRRGVFSASQAKRLAAECLPGSGGAGG